MYKGPFHCVFQFLIVFPFDLLEFLMARDRNRPRIESFVKQERISAVTESHDEELRRTESAYSERKSFGSVLTEGYCIYWVCRHRQATQR